MAHEVRKMELEARNTPRAFDRFAPMKEEISEVKW